MARVTGIGGVFIKARGDKKALSAWYEKHLGIQLDDFGGAILQWEEDTAEDMGMTVWTVAAGVEIQQGPEYHENGVFAWVMDPEGNKVELWDDKNKR